jgi:hypothetical protein
MIWVAYQSVRSVVDSVEQGLDLSPAQLPYDL